MIQYNSRHIVGVLYLLVDLKLSLPAVQSVEISGGGTKSQEILSNSG
jgi:hypothetical protein